MEEEIKEEAKETAMSEEHCKKDGRSKFHHCCGSKGNKIFLAIAVAVLIFGSGVCLGLHAGRNHAVHNFAQFPMQQNGGRMMRGDVREDGGCREQNGGCRFQGNVNQDQIQGQVQGQIEVQTQVPAQVQVQTQTAPVKTATPAK